MGQSLPSLTYTATGVSQDTGMQTKKKKEEGGKRRTKALTDVKEFIAN